MPILLPGGATWRADLWLERLVLDRIACRLTASPATAQRARRALLIGASALDLRDASSELSAIASLLEGSRRDDTGIGRAARTASGAAVADAAIDRLVAQLRGAAVPDDDGKAAFVHVRLGAIGSPDARYGLDVVALRDDGAVFFENRDTDWLRSSTARVAPDRVAQIRAWLAAAGFPRIPAFQRVPGAYTEIATVAPAGTERAELLDGVGRQTPGYRELLTEVDAWVSWLRATPDQRGPNPGLYDVVDGNSGPSEPFFDVEAARGAAPVRMPMAQPTPVSPISGIAPPVSSTPTPATGATRGAGGFPPSSVDVKGWPEALVATGSIAHALGALLGLAVGDALGAITRGQTLAAPAFPAPATGPVTDLVAGQLAATGQGGEATQMAAAIADVFWKVNLFSAGTLVVRYLDWRTIAPRVDDAVAQALAAVRGQVSAEKAGRQIWEAGGRALASNASLARTAILGVLFAGQPDTRRTMALTESAITHFDPRCQLACAVLDAAIALGVTGRGSPTAMLRAAEDEAHAAANELRARYGELRDDIDRAESAVLADLAASRSSDPGLAPDAHGASSVHVALRLAFWQLVNSPPGAAGAKRALLDVVNRGGDAATHAAVTGALLGAAHGVAALPTAWIARVLRAPGLQTDQVDFHPRGFLRVLARGFGVERDPAAMVALAPYVATAFPEFRGSRDHGLGLDAAASGAGATRIAGRTIDAWLRGDPTAGQARLAGDDGPRAVASVIQTARPTDAAPLVEIAAVAPLLATAVLDGDRRAMIETEPAGAPLSTPAFPLRAKDAAPILAQLVAIVLASAEQGVALGGLRPETVYVTAGATGPIVAGVLPRAEAWFDGAATWIAGYAAPELRAGALSSQSDVYSVAAIMVFLLTRRSPLEIAAVPGDASSAPLPAILDKRIAAALRAALHAEPDQRPTAVQLAETLTAAGVPIPPPPTFRPA